MKYYKVIILYKLILLLIIKFDSELSNNVIKNSEFIFHK